MKNLLTFILRYSAWFLFVIYAVLSCLMLFKTNPFHSLVWFTSANAVTSAATGVGSEVTSYFGLRGINKDLMESNARLENQILNMSEELNRYHALMADTMPDAQGDSPRFNYIIASVLNNNTRHSDNYFTINRGSQSGIKPGMGVTDHNGVVGITDVVAPNTSRVISVLHQGQSFSAKLKGTDYIGSLIWPGTDPKIGYLTEVPRHALYQVGDTIVTSGFSTTFPQGLMFGIVMGPVKTGDDNYFTLKVRLSPDFSNLRTVRVITDDIKAELDTLMMSDGKTDKKKS